MKDALGHGSNAHGSGVDQIGRAPLTPLWYHGSPVGEPGAGAVHVGTQLAAKVALEARIGIPADGKGWSGDREYGKTLLAGKDSLDRLSKQGYPNNGGFLETGMNTRAPKDDYYITDIPSKLKYATMGKDNTPIPLDAKPAIHSYQITGPLRPRVLSDNGANNLAYRGKLGNMGVKYKNEGEDAGSVSVVVPDKTFLKKVA